MLDADNARQEAATEHQPIKRHVHPAMSGVPPRRGPRMSGYPLGANCPRTIVLGGRQDPSERQEAATEQTASPQASLLLAGFPPSEVSRLLERCERYLNGALGEFAFGEEQLAFARRFSPHEYIGE